MRYSQLFGRSIRSVSQDVRSRGHEYLIRGGFIRESSAGRFYMLPLGMRVQEKVVSVIQEEMESLGCQQMLAPVLHPRELWEETRRTASVSFELMQVKDRNDRCFVLGGTAEEMMVAVVRGFTLSERDLPLCVYQFSTKFRDEMRARGGLLRAREFLMKDAYSFHSSRDDCERFYERMSDAYSRIFERLELRALRVAADNGYMGGDYCHEFIVEHPLGESRYLSAEDSSYCAHEDIASFIREEMNSDEVVAERYEAEALRGPSIEDGVRHYGQPAWRQIKSVVYVTDTDEKILVCIRGDLDISEAKLIQELQCSTLRLATAEEITAMGTHVGFVSPLGFQGRVRIIGDTSLRSVRNFTTGANAWRRDVLNVNYSRDFSADILADIGIAQEGHRAVATGAVLRKKRGIEVGNIFSLGTWYSERMRDATFTSSDGAREKYHMACYGIGVGRTLATIAEVHHDQSGLLWPKSAAPFDIHLIQIGSDEASERSANELYSQLLAAGKRVLFDDRDVSAGIKFADADLLGVPERQIISKKLVSSGCSETQLYRASNSSVVKL
jgi:prolyl-tRNA synthetase